MQQASKISAAIARVAIKFARLNAEVLKYIIHSERWEYIKKREISEGAKTEVARKKIYI